MGQITDLIIRSFQENAGIEPAQGRRAQRLDEMSKEAHRLIQVITLERAGICDGDGAWHGSDPIHGMIQNLVDLDRKRDEPLECEVECGDKYGCSYEPRCADTCRNDIPF